MTREEILAMKPGRELNEAVGLLVMGFTVIRDGKWAMPPGKAWVELPDYAGDIAAAWELQSKGPFAVWPYEDGKWAAAPGREAQDFYFNDSGWHEIWSDFRCDTPTEAICKAAILNTLEEQPMG